mmetsp:Transcript_155312/g.289735  ORF Transcript_155312/g.289735 Transcript_155312/m.289735 type:complete len:986 (+) Transcript_155312:42-2999(+)
MVGVAGPALSLVWQHPFVDVFKTFDVLGSAERRGDVVEQLDKGISKRTLRIRGSVSANNFVRVPSKKSPIKTLALTGEYIYLQMKTLDARFFLVHLDFTVAAMGTLRVTLSNIYTSVKATHHSVQCPCHLPKDRWSVVCINVPGALACCAARLPPHAFILKSIQLCASLYVRNVYTSDTRYTPDTMPREMLLSHHGAFEDQFSWIDIFGKFLGESTASNTAIEQTEHETSGEAQFSKVSDFNSLGKFNREVLSLELLIPDPLLQVSRLIGVSQKNRKVEGLSDRIPRRFAVFVQRGNGSGDGLGRGSIKDSSSHELGLIHEAGHELSQQDVSSRAVCASSMTLKLVDPETQAQRCYFGHSRPIEVLEASDDGMWVASAQGGGNGTNAPPLIRLWRVEAAGGLRCLSVLSCPSLSAVQVASFDPQAKFLALAGTDLQGRQQIVVWDMSRLLAGGNISLCAKQTSADWDIDCIKFSPFEELHLVTCGKESIRFWRVKDGHLPGCSVVLDSLARQSHFTCVAFEFNKMGQPFFLGEHLKDRHRMFVGTAKGKLVQILYKERKVQVVYQLHNAAITSICANEGFVITASADKYVRVWPLDFKSYYLHALHASPVIGVDLSVDGLQVLCSTADGSVGVLNMQSQEYVDFVHTHGAVIADADISLSFNEVVTASQDGTLKVWSLTSMTQTHEFAIGDDVPLVVAFHPAGRHLIAVGFRSGSMRIFDVDGLALLCEKRHHVQPILSLAFESADTSGTVPAKAQILTCDCTGALVFYDEACDFEVVRCPERTLCTAPPQHCPAIVCSPPWLLQYYDPRCLGLLSFPELDLKRKLRISLSAVSTFAFAFKPQLAVVGTTDAHLHIFEVQTGDLLITYSLTSGPLTTVALTVFDLSDPFTGLALLLLAATDGQLRVSKLCADEVMSRAGSIASPPPPNIPYDHLNEQCFIGHAVAPHKLLLAPKCMLTISSSEVICWTTVGNYFDQLFAERMLSS